MKKAICCFLEALFLLQTGSAQSSQNPDATSNDVSYEMPFELRDGFLVVFEGRIGDLQKLKFVLDTGASQSVVDRRVARRISPSLFFSDAEGNPIQSRVVARMTSSPIRAEFQNNLKTVVRTDAGENATESKAGELVDSVAFRKAARNAWRATSNGTARYEAGFSIDENGRPGELQISRFQSVDSLNHVNHVRLVSRSNALGTFHIHNNYSYPRPSELDINIAKTTHKMVYVGSRDGLYSVDPEGNG